MKYRPYYYRERDAYQELAPIPTPITPFLHLVAGIHVGRMSPTPISGEFDVVITLAEHPGDVGDGITHHHIPVSFINPDVPTLRGVAAKTYSYVMVGKKVLIRSEGGRNRPACVVGLAVVEMGGTSMDTISCTTNHGLTLMRDFRYARIVKEAVEERDQRRATT